MINVDTLKSLFLKANNKMIGRDASELIRGTSERSICANLKEMISRLMDDSPIKDYYCDVEYNRGSFHKEKIALIDGSIKSITCDLIIHSRGRFKKDNLLCLEMKKHDGLSADYDRNRLKALTDHNTSKYVSFKNDRYKLVDDYMLGIFYLINSNARRIILEFYERGKFVEQMSIIF